MKSKNLFVSALTLTLGLASCGTSSPDHSVDPTPRDNSLVVSDKTKELVLVGNLNGQVVDGHVAGLSVSENAVSEPTTVRVTRLEQAPALPAVEGVYASYLMGEVPGSRLTGAWRVQMDKVEFDNPATLDVQREASITSQALEDTITEVFLKNNLSGEIQIVNTFYNDEPLNIIDFADKVNEQGEEVDFTYFSYTAGMDAYKATCTSQGGEMVDGYCSFENKDVAPSGIMNQSINGMKFVTWNVGNVAITCKPYNFKICYHSTQRRATERLMNIEKSGKPAVVMLQEMWNGNCTSSMMRKPFWTLSYRLCESSAGVKSAERIFGNRYDWTCTAVAYDPRVRETSNGWECLGVDPKQVEIVNAFPVDRTGFHPECADYSKSFDTGFQPVVLRHKSTNQTFYAVNTHLTGTPEATCRATQIDSLGAFLRRQGTPDVLIAGDFNTEPFDESGGGGQAFRQQFGLQASAQPAVASLISSGSTNTAFYANGAYAAALDHVVGENFNGSCRVAGQFSGMDHRMMTCNLNHLF